MLEVLVVLVLIQLLDQVLPVVPEKQVGHIVVDLVDQFKDLIGHQ